MGRNSPNMPWPSRSPDLFPMDFFLWGYIKSLFYTSTINNLHDLKTLTRSAFNQVTVHMRHKTSITYCDRLQRCLDIEGGHNEVIYALKISTFNVLLYDVFEKYMVFVETRIGK